MAKTNKAGGLPIQPDPLVGLAVPIVAALMMGALRRAKQRLRQKGTGQQL